MPSKQFHWPQMTPGIWKFNWHPNENSNSMQQSFWKISRHFPNKLSSFYGTRKLITVPLEPVTGSTLSLMNPVHILIAYFLNTDLNIILQSTTTSPKQHHSFKSSDHILFNFVCPLHAACSGNLILLKVLYFVKTPNFSCIKNGIQVMSNDFSDFPPRRTYCYKENFHESLFSSFYHTGILMCIFTAHRSYCILPTS